MAKKQSNTKKREPKRKLESKYIGLPNEPKQPLNIEVNIEIHPRVPYYKPLSEILREGFISAYIGAITGLIILAFAFI